jgi:hypothetical protein
MYTLKYKLRHFTHLLYLFPLQGGTIQDFFSLGLARTQAGANHCPEIEPKVMKPGSV